MEWRLFENLEFNPKCDRSKQAECYAALRGSSEGLRLQAMAKDMGLRFQVIVHTDAGACKGIIQRQGPGKLRHMDVAMLWL